MDGMRGLLCAGALLLGGFAGAPACHAAAAPGPFQRDYVEQVRIGDGQTRLGARQVAVEEIQRRAAREAGAFVEGSSELVNGELHEAIRQVAAAIVRVEVTDESLDLADGQPRLTVEAVATIDESVMVEHITALREDRTKARAIDALARDHERLQSELLRLARARHERLSSRELLDVMAREDSARHEIEANLARTRATLRSVRADIAAADREAVATATGFAPVADAWDAEFFRPLEDVHVTARLTSLRLSPDGRWYNGVLSVSWESFEAESLREFACQRFQCVEQAEVNGVTAVQLKTPMIAVDALAPDLSVATMRQQLLAMLDRYDILIDLQLGPQRWTVPLLKTPGARFSHVAHRSIRVDNPSGEFLVGHVKSVAPAGTIDVPVRFPAEVLRASPTLMTSVVRVPVGELPYALW